MLKDVNDHFKHFKSCNQAILHEFNELKMTLKKQYRERIILFVQKRNCVIK